MTDAQLKAVRDAIGAYAFWSDGCGHMLPSEFREVMGKVARSAIAAYASADKRGKPPTVDPHSTPFSKSVQAVCSSDDPPTGCEFPRCDCKREPEIARRAVGAFIRELVVNG